MPDIGYEMQLRQRMQDPNSESSPMGALRALGNSVGSAWQGYQGRNDEQEATQFFLKNPATPETIQEFASTHPQMPLMDVYKTAGMIQTQKKAQGMKDKMRTLTNAISSGAEMNEKLLPTLFPDASPAEMAEFGKILTGMQQQGMNFKSLKEKDRFKPIGAQGLYDTETKGIIGQPTEKTTPLADAIKAKMLEVNPDTTEPYTAAEAYRLVAHPVTPKDDLVLGADGKYVKKEAGVVGYVKPDVHSPERLQQEKDLKAAGRQPTPPEIKPGAALKRMSAIKSAIARLNSGGSIDALLLAQIPEYAGLMASNDPEARKEAITQLQAELDYVKGFAPKGAPSVAEVKPGGKILDKKTAMAIFEKAGRNKAVAEKMARDQGYTF